ncbi:amino acid permease [Pseudonocardia acaciae]|uniref:amino acid permease n=1 Tax=Pseudonocardia acaciae TaxID=551276 RepID=UPI0005647446|nr:amino acid permease [Pseudonocardia acaciae]
MELSKTTPGNTGLRRSLRNRHMMMIAIGGNIGAGLFVGSGTVIGTAGPIAVLSYLLAGILVLFTMRMLGEMVVAKPSAGSFSDYARMTLGPWAGFTVGWLYWWYIVVVVGFEVVAAAGILRQWIDMPLWVLALVVLVVFTLTNLFSVRTYGEVEFWFASIKIAAIVVFLVIGALFVLGAWPGAELSFVNLTGRGGFAPHGVMAMASAIVVVIVALVGAEIVTIAAGETSEPQRSVAKATTGVLWRVMLFYVGSVFLVVTIISWEDAEALKSPYVTVLERVGLPSAATVMNVIILIAVLSVLNSILYVSSRMLFVLARHGDAPRAMVALTRNRVPARAILAGTTVGFLSVVMAYYSPDAVFSFLINSSGTIALFVYLIITVSHLRLRKRLEREEPEALTLKMWGYPYLTYLTIACFCAVLVSMAVRPDQRIQLVAGCVSLAVILVAYALRRRRASSAAR